MIHSATPGYFDWRNKHFVMGEDLYSQACAMSTETLLDVYNELAGGFAAERLNAEQSNGDFHFAVGLFRGIFYGRGVVPPW